MTRAESPIEWRADLRASAAALAAALETWGDELVLLGHGTGGLLARWVAERLDPQGRVAKLLLLGCPNRGLAKLAFCRRGEPSTAATRRYREILKTLGA